MSEACSSCSSTPGVSNRPIIETPSKRTAIDTYQQNAAQLARRTDDVQFSAEAQRLLETEKMYGAR